MSSFTFYFIIQFEIGSSVLVQMTESSDYHAGMISDIEENMYGIIYDDEGLEDEEQIQESRLVPLAIDKEEASEVFKRSFFDHY